MPILTVRHVTTYHYKQPVAFGEHRMMLRPRDDDDQKVLESELEITPEPSELTWTQDIFGNHVAIAHFAERASDLRFASKAPVASTMRCGDSASAVATCRDWSGRVGGKRIMLNTISRDFVNPKEGLQDYLRDPNQ